MIENKLKIAVIPYDIVWGDIKENLLSVAELLSKVKTDTDIVVLPEMFTTGFTTDDTLVASLAETNSGKTISKLHQWASFFNFAICGSFIASTASGYYNRAFFIEPSGDETFYDKKHLFSIGGESRIFNHGGRETTILRYRGWNIRLAVCYDIRFPVWCRNTNNCYDILIVPANWPESRSYPWNQLLIARAIENQSFVVGANRSGRDDYGTYNITDTLILDYKGYKIGTYDADNIVYAEFSKNDLYSFREKFPVWKDSDKFSFD